MINLHLPAGKLALLGTMLLAAAQAWQAASAGVTLNGEPDPKNPDLRLWLRADSGVKDAQGRGPEDPEFSGRVAAWSDRSTRKCDVAAAPGQAPMFIPKQPGAGNRPSLAFTGGQLLTKANSALFDRATSTVLVVVQADPQGGVFFSVGKNPNAREFLGETFDGAWNVTGAYMTNAGEKGASLRSEVLGGGRPVGRFAAILSNGEPERRWLEYHDGLSDLMGTRREVLPGPLASDKCGPEFFLGGSDKDFFYGQIAEVIVFNRGLSAAERREVLDYVRRRYELDMTDVLLPPGTFLLQAEEFEGKWMQGGPEGARYLGGHVTAEGPAADEGIKTTIRVPRDGNYHVWVRAFENNFGATGPAKSTVKTTVNGKALDVTHNRGPGGVFWREAGVVELKSGPAEIVVRGEGPGPKNVDAVLISPVADTPEAVDEICILAHRLSRSGDDSRLTAILENGLRLDGSLATGWRWMGPSGPIARPDAASLAPIACIRFDRRPAETSRDPAIVPDNILEFHNGDRLRGTICGYVPANKGGPNEPAKLLVRPSGGVGAEGQPTLAVEIDWLRRAVFDQSPREGRCPPRTLLCRDGRRLVFRAVRWSEDSVSVLTEENLEKIPMANVAELRMADEDPWTMYYRQLAALDPDGKSHIVRMDTSEGVVMTAVAMSQTSGVRRAQRGEEAIASQRLWQPAWCKSPVTVPWPSVRVMWQAPAHVVPLSRFSPEQAMQRGVLGASWKWQTDRNVAGGELRSGGLDYLWGFGVHAPNGMAFRLPECVRAFRGSVGIDDVVGNTGHVVAKVYLDKTTGTPLYQSKPLAGTDMAVSTGEIGLTAGQDRRLLLVTECGDAQSSPGDQLDIGNHVDWLEPVLLLDPAKLRAAVAPYLPAKPK